MKHGQREGGRFSGTCLCEADDVAAAEGEGDGLRLNGGWVGVAKGSAGFAQRVDDALEESVVDSKSVDLSPY